MKAHRIWLIGGFEGAGAVGVLADKASLATSACLSHTVLTLLTVQQPGERVYLEPVSTVYLAAQIKSAYVQGKPDVIKVGAIGSVAHAHYLKNELKKWNVPIVFDPVLYSSSGEALFADEAAAYFSAIRAFIGICTWVTPNLFELATLAQHAYDGLDIVSATQAILDLGAQHVVVKGGHATSSMKGCDYYRTAFQSARLRPGLVSQRTARGTGCALATHLAEKYLYEADPIVCLMHAKHQLTHRLHTATQTCTHSILGPPVALPNKVFEPKHVMQLGLYPIVNQLDHFKRLVALGFKHIQLRLKQCSESDKQKIIAAACVYAKLHGVHIWVNDDWRAAVKYGAYGVHVGQTDLASCDIHAIKTAGLKCGISTHNATEIARALLYQPDYIAFGTVFHTNSKVMAFPPQGLDTLACVVRETAIPVVAIGGITATNLPDVLKTGVAGAAMISAVDTSQSDASILALLALWRVHHVFI